MTTEQHAVIDEDQLGGLAEVAGTEAVQAILDAFWSSTEELSTELSTALHDADAENAIKLGHALKGSSANVGAAAMAARAKAIELAAREGELDVAQKAFIEFAKDINATRLAMDNLLIRYG
ncbi:hypothetical protein PB2503_00997 [Parvularcula bermudensis HTCC2503]|uniref:HPt domain-containing protein n=1 Tax=Parvularcula bermudensis (strain ATCC BAA-594 / HTCC2503 / KCTC 12087) TaxID=314260 RepID=E0TB76_PARBH|nr:Hpt domain-containing protein [Parvularcula bermudensis]ADM08280.1 hypothetical protein PB2503_00997 [Parvularcula bermudensis HTCC2503]